jgi:hypothetical protein
LRDAHDRAAADYPARVGRRLRECWERQKYSALLEELQNHPFVLPAADMADLRARVCEQLARSAAAAAFHADSLRLESSGRT